MSSNVRHLTIETLRHNLGNLNSIGESFDFHLAKDITLNLKKTSCRQFYKVYAEKINTEPTAIKSFQNHCPEVVDNWMHCMQSSSIKLLVIS